jgi:hypothetical protein
MRQPDVSEEHITAIIRAYKKYKHKARFAARVYCFLIVILLEDQSDMFLRNVWFFFQLHGVTTQKTTIHSHHRDSLQSKCLKW